jgi:hypothetical protein
MIGRVSHQAETWLDGQEKRDKGYGVDQYRMQSIRISLEDRLNELREKLALVYDFQGDRGMADFAPAGFNNGNEEVEEEEEGDCWVDIIAPKKEEKMMSTALMKYDPIIANLHLALSAH